MILLIFNSVWDLCAFLEWTSPGWKCCSGFRSWSCFWSGIYQCKFLPLCVLVFFDVFFPTRISYSLFCVNWDIISCFMNRVFVLGDGIIGAQLPCSHWYGSFNYAILLLNICTFCHIFYPTIKSGTETIYLLSTKLAFYVFKWVFDSRLNCPTILERNM